MKRNSNFISLIIFAVVIHAGSSFAGSSCGSFFNPVSDIEWSGIFPIKIAGVAVGKSGLKEPSDPTSSPVCICPMGPVFRMGIPLSFWDPSRLIETVKTPYCFPTVGFSKGSANGKLGGTHGGGGNEEDSSTFAQAHYFIFPVFSMLGVDSLCLEGMGFDVGYITEVDPLWNDDELASIINPEAILFGNIIAQKACIADSVAANAGLPLDALFWCFGSHGSAYPMTGHVGDNDYVQANMTVAERLVSKLSRQMLIWDGATDICTQVIVPIVKKSHWRFQIAKPVKGSQVVPFGRTSLIWGAAKNPTTGKGDNFLFVGFRKRACCVL
ncbi:MAG: TraU family protein [Proteobacteria bacterium]|nr:TraU family protein [Pseudomonadota bacterium]